MILNLFGFDPPSGEKAVNPVGNDACALIRTKAGSASAFSKQRHAMVRSFNHNTNETFVPLGGMWRFTWESSPAHTEFVDLGPCDTIGRVHFNLAESRRDPESHSLLWRAIQRSFSARAKAQHLALREYAGAATETSSCRCSCPCSAPLKNSLADADDRCRGIFHPLCQSVPDRDPTQIPDQAAQRPSVARRRHRFVGTEAADLKWTSQATT